MLFQGENAIFISVSLKRGLQTGIKCRRGVKYSGLIAVKVYTPVSLNITPQC